MVPKIPVFLSLISFFLFVSPSHPQSILDGFRECINTDDILYFPWDPSYEPVLEYTIQNLRLLNYSNPKPLAIITPEREFHVRYAVQCSKRFGFQVRVRSGGHDYEGMSYTSLRGGPSFVLVDLVKLTSVYDIDIPSRTAWVQSGATLGQLYYWLNENTQDFSFAGGICPSVGVGGLISGGGIGYMTRRNGLASDNVIDARIVDVDGNIRNRQTMGEEVFWALRGGGAASFGIILAWRIRLVPIPRTVTVFNISRTLEQGGIEVLHRAQTACNTINTNLRMRVEVSTTNGITQVKFSSVFLGSIDELLQAMRESFPELGITRDDCEELSWIDAIMFFYYPKGEPKESLRDRKPLPKSYFKSKSDFVTEPISPDVLREIWNWCSQKPNFRLIMHFFGGRMEDIPEDQTAFPFRRGNLYDIEYSIQWQVADPEVAKENIQWIRRLHNYMAPYVSKNPRGAFSNFRDYDLGVNKVTGATYEEAIRWGEMYFKTNFRRLATIKGGVDPQNFFGLEQTIPPLLEREKFSPTVAAS